MNIEFKNIEPQKEKNSGDGNGINKDKILPRRKHNISIKDRIKYWKLEKNQVEYARRQLGSLYDDFGQVGVESALPELIQKANESLPGIKEKIKTLEARKERSGLRGWFKRLITPKKSK